ncbi:hypothetical protein J1N35_010029 [Gossypium stocksii]|uniref:Protein phosphatase inhibitor 2 n=1 Tax=Gossypium stocksii TaxID=47602 RepID=A0A9D4ACD1_9ROSI|nr:hypothetical protein J1N35_010029 [Gossypium stocksii]
MKKRVSWNEANLREIEANKQETKKIDEPKTPYPSTIEDGSSVKSIDFAAHAEALKNALNKLAFTEEHNSPFEETCQDEDQGLAKQKDSVSFEERRRAHYDEFKKVKEVQEKGCSLDDELDNSIHVSDSGSTLDIDSIEIDIEDDDDEILQIIDIEETDDLSFPQNSRLVN